MSQENVEVARQVVEAFNRGGVAATAPFVARDLQVHPFPEWPGPPLYRGMDGLTKLAEEWTENFDDYAWDVQRLIGAGERVVLLFHHGGRTKGQGVAVHQPVGAVFWLRGGRVARMDYFLRWREALEAAGLRE
jgi:ketosteroid isomerase-like protein